MINLKLYGQPTSTYEYAKMTVLEEASKTGIEINLIEVNDVNAFIEEGIKSVPTFKINDHLEINLSKNQDLGTFLKTTIQTILREENYGTLKKVLVPTDFSETSKNAINYAIDMARDLNMVVKIMHAYHPVVAEANGVGIVDPQIEQLKRTQLRELVEISDSSKTEILDKPFIDEEFRIGYASEEIKELSHEEDVDYIVLGSTGLGNQLKKWFGSVSLEVAKKATCPVLVVPPNVSYQSFQNVLYATDNPKIDIKVLKALSDFLQSYNYTLHLVHVNTKKSPSTINDLKKIAEEIIPEKIVKAIEVVAEDVVHGLNEYVEHESIDLLVMAREKRNLWKDVIHTSITRRMALHTQTALMIYHDGDKACKGG